VPVRIIFRGLILFNVDKEGEESGTITAKLIDGPEMFHHDMGEAASPHRHVGEMQIYPGETPVPAVEIQAEAPAHGDMHMDAGGESASSIPFEYVILEPGANVNLTINSDQFVQRDDTYKDLCPKLHEIAKTARLERHGDKELKAKFVRNTVTINRGTIRVRDVVSWDAGAPELGNHRRTGINAPVGVSFIGSDTVGYVASECVIDILDADSVTIDDKEFRGIGVPSVHVAPNMVEILITNFAPQRTKPLPWSLHYRWMFEAAGYRARPLPKADLDRFEKAVAGYDEATLHAEKAMFLGADNGETIGLPFPYIDLNNRVVASLTPTGSVPALTTADPWDRPLCPLGDCGTTGEC
jgi:hypothetical protein